MWAGLDMCGQIGFNAQIHIFARMYVFATLISLRKGCLVISPDYILSHVRIWGPGRNPYVVCLQQVSVDAAPDGARHTDV